ncbi:MAG: YbhB/YbcL family Raf kinase inhibitor-like protein [Candidatus Doudnabacteria bacterium]|nr:YbhB/YbcL family Raf kinase inhibitor-like protein [Candidatus Doudnabacteria bacterium]
MQLSSPAFNYGEPIPRIYTCDGQNINPPLVISGVSQQAASLVLIMEDPDVPPQIKINGLFVHWIVWDIPVNVNKIAQDSEPLGTVGYNTSGGTGYTGPCPPDREHRYFFKLFALDKNLADVKISNRDDLLAAMEGHVLEESGLMGVYDRAKK